MKFLATRGYVPLNPGPFSKLSGFSSITNLVVSKYNKMTVIPRAKKVIINRPNPR